jgi:hypothetical protein
MVVFKLAPAEFLIGMKNNMDAGLRCLVHTHPKFRERAQQGFNIVVGGKGFGCGSSREQAVMALLGKSSPTRAFFFLSLKKPFDESDILTRVPFRVRCPVCHS